MKTYQDRFATLKAVDREVEKSDIFALLASIVICVVVINPPFTLEEKLLGLMPWLADTLAQGDGYGWRVDGGLTDEDVEEGLEE